MDQKIIFIVCPVCHLVLSERHVTDGNIKEIIRIVGLFKSFDLHICLWIELLCDTSRDTVQLHAIQPAFFHGIRHHPKEIADTHRRF